MKSNAPLIVANATRYVKNIDKSIEDALNECGLRGVGITKKNTPVKTGRLRNSMSYAIKNKSYGSPDEPDDSVKQPTAENTLVVGTNVIYAPSVEYRSKTISKGFMLRAYKQWKPIAEKIIAETLGKVKI